MKIREQFFFLFILFVSSSLFSCERDSDTEEETEDTEETSEEVSSEASDNSDDYTWESSEEIAVSLSDSSIECDSTGVSISGSTLTITAAGTYLLSGSLSDGQIIVDSEDEDLVRIILNGVDISCSYNSAIYVRNADRTMIVLQDDTENYLSDGSSYTYAESDDDSNACIYSKDDLTIYGDGYLNVSGNYNDGITSKDGLIINCDLIEVDAVDDGIRGKDYFYITDADLVIYSGGDGLKSDNDEDPSVGYITIETGNFDITASGDAIAAETDLTITYAEMNLISGGGSNGSSSSSTKGLKAGSSITITNGTFDINSADDAIHSNGSISISEGSFEIASGDDAIHADSDLDVNGGYFNITESYEGLESAEGDINIYDGEIYIVSSDDGINISAGNTSSGNVGTRSTSSYTLTIEGGTIFVNASGDGLDSNDDITMSGGTVIVSGSTSSSNSALDYDGSFLISGGLLVASGTTQMAEAPGTSSSQYSVMISFSSTQKADQMVHIESADGDDIVTIEPQKAFQSLVVSSPDFEKGSTYNIYLGGSYSGTEDNGFYTDGTYSGGTKYSSFSISSTVSYVN
ncbi:carbohydrate-binding domain-containing protein [Labilibaculum sp.]|uniref:carbohydrate-binding domain-containing protein n=1 Tax=Labilibaculum sp. TaxID=2060723 RepID=UPI0035649A63